VKKMVKIEKKKKKTIPLSKRERKRYVLIEILNAEVAEKDFYFGFWIELLGFFGSRGLAEINPRIVLYKNNKVIVKCKRSKEVELIAGLAFVNKIRNKKVILNPLLTSGTIKKLKTEAGIK
jgi:RNase P/RNase MRP subunit POP5